MTISGRVCFREKQTYFRICANCRYFYLVSRLNFRKGYNFKLSWPINMQGEMPVNIKSIQWNVAIKMDFPRASTCTVLAVVAFYVVLAVGQRQKVADI